MLSLSRHGRHHRDRSNLGNTRVNHSPPHIHNHCAGLPHKMLEAGQPPGGLPGRHPHGGRLQARAWCCCRAGPGIQHAPQDRHRACKVRPPHQVLGCLEVPVTRHAACHDGQISSSKYVQCYIWLDQHSQRGRKQLSVRAGLRLSQVGGAKRRRPGRTGAQAACAFWVGSRR